MAKIKTEETPITGTATATPTPFEVFISSIMAHYSIPRMEAVHYAGLMASPLSNVKNDPYKVYSKTLAKDLEVRKGADPRATPFVSEIVAAAAGLKYKGGYLANESFKEDLVKGLAGIGVGRVSKATDKSKESAAAM